MLKAWQLLIVDSDQCCVLLPLCTAAGRAEGLISTYIAAASVATNLAQIIPEFVAHKV